MTKNIFKVNFKFLRLERKLSQEKLGNSLGVSSKTISAWELNKFEPTFSTLIVIAEYFNVSLNYLSAKED